MWSARRRPAPGRPVRLGSRLFRKIDPALNKPQAMILCPTRELCLQIAEELSHLAQFLPEIRIAALYGRSAD